ncbi:PIR protein [Plasmodium ovale]|uniref:PIR Superfamily Protein n=2 Tax=Plasmodium ovale TaxID=36330 RepID=A0A1A8WEI7_PLAOA|nr:PIR Superfamily Protein [Plasmodium ovale curtisi]SBT82971.1 PIR protein [Plasmodium ovale]
MTHDTINIVLPSKKNNLELENKILYYEINNIITDNSKVTEILEWSRKLKNNVDNYLNGYIGKSSQVTLDKRCRDIFYILEVIIRKIKRLNKSQTYQNIESNINTVINSNVPVKCNGNSSKISSTENDQVINDKKLVDDLCEDVAYINNNITQINDSPYCSVLRERIEQENNVLDAKLGTNKEKYTDILKFYEFSSFDSLKDIIQKLNCNSYVDAPIGDEEDNPDEIGQLSRHQVPILVVLSLLGILCICFFLYKTTPFGHWLNILLRKKKYIWNNFFNQGTREISEDISENKDINSHNIEYNIIYNSLKNS